MTAPPLTFVCPVCLVAVDDTACDVCGRPLTAADIQPEKLTAASGAPAEEAPLTADERNPR